MKKHPPGELRTGEEPVAGDFMPGGGEGARKKHPPGELPAGDPPCSEPVDPPGETLTP